MRKINKTKYAILGMLMEKPRSGYDIIHMMTESTSHFWQESDASIYPMLKKLESDGMVKSRSEFVGKRERNIIEITNSGKQEFLEWMTIPAEPGTIRDEFLLKLFFGANVSKDTMLKQLNEKLDKLQETKKRFRQIESEILPTVSDSYPHKIFWELALKNGLASAMAEINWIKECIKTLDKK